MKNTFNHNKPYIVVEISEGGIVWYVIKQPYNIPFYGYINKYYTISQSHFGMMYYDIEFEDKQEVDAFILKEERKAIKKRETIVYDSSL